MLPLARLAGECRATATTHSMAEDGVLETQPLRTHLFSRQRQSLTGSSSMAEIGGLEPQGLATPICFQNSAYLLIGSTSKGEP